MLEIVQAFSDLVHSGKAHYWGTVRWADDAGLIEQSMWSAARLLEAYEVAERHHLIPPTADTSESTPRRADSLTAAADA